MAMLLYDRVLEHISRVRKRHQNSDALMSSSEKVVWDGLRKAVVYDIRSIAILFDDWLRERTKDVPRLPPHDVVWCEWECEYEESMIEIGALIQFTGDRSSWQKAIESEKVDTKRSNQENAQSWDKLFGVWDHVWQAKVFRRVVRMETPGLKFLINEITSDSSVFYFAMDKDGRKVEEFYVPIPISHRESGCFDTIVWGPGEGGVSLDKSSFPWPPLMAFALLHCRNVVENVQVPDERTQRRVIKSGNPPRATCRTLRVEVPREFRPQVDRGPSDAENNDPRVRFHLCSGHFKHLTHECFKNKRGQWVWCQAHYRGSKELGTVQTRYQLSARSEKAP